MITESALDPAQLEAELARTRDELGRYQQAMRAVIAVCREAARGDLEPRVPDLELGTEADEMRRAVNHLLDLTDAFVREAGASLTYAGEGKFFRRVLSHGLLGSFRRGAVTINRSTHAMAEAAQAIQRAETDRLRLAGEFEQAVKSLSDQVAAAATEMRATASGLSETAIHTSAQAGLVSHASDRAAQGMTTIASATEELSSTVGEIERQVRVSDCEARKAVSEVERTSATVQSLDEASRQIGQVITVITHVANQTRLLALNATIEAARAGESGKGFAVVASEVKNLASQTAEATDRISQQVMSIQGAAAQAVEAIGGIGTTIRGVQQISATIASAVTEQRSANGEISRSIHEAATETRTVTGSMQQVTRATEETCLAAGQMETAASELSQLGEQLRSEVDRFLREIRGQ